MIAILGLGFSNSDCFLKGIRPGLVYRVFEDVEYAIPRHHFAGSANVYIDERVEEVL